MNNKGFTLVELLVTLVLLGIIATISITGVVSVMNNSKNSEYKVLLKNIDTGSKMFYEDCEYGSLSGKDICKNNRTISGDKTEITYTIPISALTQYGFLTGNSSGEVVNPKTNKPLNENCTVTVIYNKNNREYTITKATTISVSGTSVSCFD